MADIQSRFLCFCRERIGGSGSTSPAVLERYAEDRSIFRIPPVAVLFPADEEDLMALMAFAGEERLSITARGGGSGTGGAALGGGIVVDFARFDRYSEPQKAERGALIVVGSGLRHDVLQRRLASEGLFLPINLSSAAISRIGGNVSTKASGPYALRYGAIDRWIDGARFIDGEGRVVIATNRGADSSVPSDVGYGLKRLRSDLLSDSASMERLRRKAGLKTASGYNLGALLACHSAADAIPSLLCGSIGTLGLITEVTLRCLPLPAERIMVLVGFRDEAVACAAAAALADGYRVDAVEFIDAACLKIAQESELLPIEARDGSCLLIVAISGEGAGEAWERHLPSLFDCLSGFGIARLDCRVASSDDADYDRWWKARRTMLGMLSRYRGRRAYAVVNDIGVPPPHLPEFLRRARGILGRFGVVAPIFGHAGIGNLHLRPLFDPDSPMLLRDIETIAEAIYSLTLALGGTVTAEHGMGWLRAPWLRREWGDSLYRHMVALKRLFDPANLLNPAALFPGPSDGFEKEPTLGQILRRHSALPFT